MKRKITSHKGGRDKMKTLRLSQDEISLIDKAKKDLSLADYIVKKVKEDTESGKNT